MHLALAFAVALAVAVTFVECVGTLSKLAVLTRQQARKAMHIGTGPLFLATWMLFPEHPASRYVAACVPLLMSIRFAAVGAGVVGDAALVAGATRHGQRQELLKGPLAYGLVHTAATLLWWRDSPASVVALCTLCAGDGAAEVVGRSRLGKLLGQLPWNRRKTVAGTLACFLCGWLAAVPLVAAFRGEGYFIACQVGGSVADQAGEPGAATKLLGDWRAAGAAAIATAVGAAVESLPFRGLQDWDNVSVPVAAGLLMRWLVGC